MQKAPPKAKGSARSRKSGRTSFEKSGKGIWDWQTATGVFEQRITDEQLAELENSQLTFLDQQPKASIEPAAVSYYEFRERSNSMVPARASSQPQPQPSPLKRLFSRFSRKD